MTVAFEAGRVPNRTEYELFGSRIGDWVSAIEILCRSKIGHVNSKNTTAYYGDINWMIGELSHKRHINMHDKTGNNRLTVVQKLCQQLYCARNAFLHGERIKVSHLRAFGGRSTIMLLHIAPILYRIVIAQMLGTYPSKHKVERMAMEDYLDYRALHKPFENALVAAKHRANTT
jgi:hypothetical protein